MKSILYLVLEVTSNLGITELKTQEELRKDPFCFVLRKTLISIVFCLLLGNARIWYENLISKWEKEITTNLYFYQEILKTFLLLSCENTQVVDRSINVSL